MYFAVANIPSTFHSKDLRNYFSFFTERNAFACFHYYHRRTLSFMKYLQENKQIFLDHQYYECNSSHDFAEVLSFFLDDLTHSQKSDLPEGNKLFNPKTALNFQDINLNLTSLQDNLDFLEKDLGYCCFVKVNKEFSKEFKYLYHRKCWVTYIGEVFPTRCLIFNIEMLVHAHKAYAVEQDKFASNYRYLSKSKPGHEINLSKIEHLKEFQMGLELPYGNVGTASAFLKSQLQLCKLPSSLIKKLGLDFQPKTSKKRHNQVHLDYKTTVLPVPEIDHKDRISSNMIFTSSGHLIPGYFDVKFNKKLDKSSIKPTLPIIETTTGNVSDDEVEMWDKYDEIYEDQRHREMSKDKLFESEMEQVWEKGGSGLVFWTDAQFWRVEDNESEESDADDWDLSGDNYVDAQDKTSINFLQDLKLNPDGYSAFANKKFFAKNMNKSLKKQTKMSKPVSDHHYDHVEGMKLQSDNIGKQKFKKVPKLEQRDSMTSRIERNKKENAVDQQIMKALLDFKQSDSGKKKKTSEGNSMGYGEFEKYSKGIGSRLLKSQGWQEGLGLGKNSNGIVNPVNVCAVAQQHMKREGIGFHVAKSKKLSSKATSSTSNQLPDGLKSTTDNSNEPMKSYAPLIHINQLINKSDNLKFMEHEFKITNSQNEINSVGSNILHDLHIFPHRIRFQKSSLGS